MGYESTILIENLGAFFIFAMIVIPITLFYFMIVTTILKCCRKRVSERFQVFHSKVDKIFIWGFFIRAGLEVYLEFFVGVCLNLKFIST